MGTEDEDTESDRSDQGHGEAQLFLFEEAKIEEPDRNTWCTPKWITDAVGPVDLDPCANERSHVQAARTFRLDHGQDGLALARYVGRDQRVFINPPYEGGQVIRWVRAYRHTRFCFLVRLDNSTDWFGELEPALEMVCVPNPRVVEQARIEFEPPPGVKASSNPFPHGLLYARADDVTAEVRRLFFTWRPERWEHLSQRNP